jgi:hypothetical protein
VYFLRENLAEAKTMADDDETKTMSTREKLIGLALASPIFLALALIVGLVTQ